MQRIALTKAAPGMVLAQAVHRQEGLVLVGEGIALTESIIDRIRQAGIGTVWVEGNPLGGGGSVGNLRVVADNLPFMFRRHKDNVFMMTLFSVFARHFAIRLAEQRALEDATIEAARKSAAGDGEATASARGAK